MDNSDLEEKKSALRCISFATIFYIVAFPTASLVYLVLSIFGTRSSFASQLYFMLIGSVFVLFLLTITVIVFMWIHFFQKQYEKACSYWGWPLLMYIFNFFFMLAITEM